VLLRAGAELAGVSPNFRQRDQVQRMAGEGPSVPPPDLSQKRGQLASAQGAGERLDLPLAQGQHGGGPDFLSADGAAALLFVVSPPGFRFTQRRRERLVRSHLRRRQRGRDQRRQGLVHGL
jgi:hypothetical protein